MRILVAGMNVRHIVGSAARAGHRVYCVDKYLDLDTIRYSEAAFPWGIDLNQLIRNLDPDGVVLGPGAERMEVDLRGSQLLSIPPSKMHKLLNKLWVQTRIEEMGIVCPKIYWDSPRFPCVAKPIYGAGGHLNMLINDENQLQSLDLEGYFLQEFIPGIHISLSLIAFGDSAQLVCINEQLLGLRFLNQRSDFGYCGNITPFPTKLKTQLGRLGSKIAAEFELKGSIGIDFVINRSGCYLIELNPRFQGSLDTLELSTGANLFQLHLAGFQGRKISIPNPRRYASKLILYAPQDCILTRDLSFQPMIADIPRKGSRIPAGAPVATGLGIGPTRLDSLREAYSRVRLISRSLKPSN